MDLRQLFIDPSESEVAILGGGYLQNFIRDGSLSNGFCIVSDKRVYFKGQCYHKVNNRFTSSKEEKTVDLKDITGVSFSKNSKILVELMYWLFVIIQCVAAVSICFSRHGSSYLTNEEAYPIIGITILLVIIGIIVEIKVHRTYYEIQFAGGCIAFNASKYADHEMKEFQKKLVQAKDRRLVEERMYVQPVQNVQPMQYTNPVINAQNTDKSVVDELKSLKDLLDCGAITHEEFEQCKSKILNK